VSSRGGIVSTRGGSVSSRGGSDPYLHADARGSHQPACQCE
jgi:hypothetical protein